MPNKTSHEDLKLRSEEVQEILSTPPAWIIRWGITLILIFTVIILILSFIIRYPDYVTAKVIVTTERPTERIVARQSGPLEKIYVVNGDTVEAGQRLAVIRNTANIDDVYRLKGILDTVRSVSKGFFFPIDITSNLVLGDIETAYINFEKSYIDFQLLKDLDPHANRLLGNRRSLAEIKQQLKDQIKQKQLLEQEYQIKKIDFERHKILFEQRVISQQGLEVKELEFLQVQKNINAMAISISQMRGAITLADHNLRSTRIDQQEDDTRFMANLSQAYNVLRKAVRDWEHGYMLSSSIQGIVGFQEFWGENQFVSSGEVVFSILPMDTSALVGKLVLPSQNAGKVIAGQKVLVKLDNFPFQQYGMLLGKVKNISISPDKAGNYFVYIEIPEGTKTSYGQKLPFDQELLGNAEIITEDLSVAQRIFYKFRDVFKYE